jgi:uncharacterized protein YbjT (DUF2867 family)
MLDYIMNITILGANGQTGIELTKQALSAGHKVIGLVRKNESGLSDPKLEYVIGDATKEEDVTKATQDSDVIVSVLGGMSPTLMTNAINAAIASTKNTGVRRFILMSSFAVKQDRLATAAKVMTSTAMGPMIKDKATSEGALKASDLDWTIVYATLLSNDPDTSGVRVVPESEKVGMKNGINRAAVAAFILQEIAEPKYIKAEVLITQR